MSDDDINLRILGYMRRAPGGNYTAVQLSRNTGLTVAQVQQALADLERANAIVRAPHLAYPAYCLTAHEPTRAGHMTLREATERTRSQPAA